METTSKFCRLRQTILACCFLLIASAALCPASFAAAPKEANAAAEPPDFVKIPVFYVTDRNKVNDSFGPNRKYVVDCLHDMYYGTVFATATNDNDRMPDKTFEKLAWTGVNEVTEKVARKDMIEKPTNEENKQEFFNRLSAALAHSGSDHFCLYLHGAAAPFEDAAKDAAQMAYYMECPVVLYSWPSYGKLRKYRIDEGNVEWSQEHYNTFLRDLDEFEEKHPVKVSLIAHSVGNRLLARSVYVMRRTDCIQDVSLVSPDIDAEIFKHYVMNFRNRGVTVRLYVSNRDKVLPFTQMLYGGYYRLGSGVGSMLSIMSSPQRSLAQAGRAMRRPFGHHGHDSHPHGAGAPTRLEKIDFTALDARWIGHQFPFALVAAMSRSGQPGEGLTLLPEQAASGNKLARFACWLNDLPPNDETKPGLCRRVVHTDSLKTQQASLPAPVQN